MSKGHDPRERIILEHTIYQELPQEAVEIMKRENLRIRLDKMVANRLVDQAPGMMATDGCISAPSGPSC